MKRKKPRRPGLPAPESVREVLEFTSPKLKAYHILKTTERDASDEPLSTKRKPLRRRQPKR